MRRGLGYGRGQGYYNLMMKDPYVHSLSARGIKTNVNIPMVTSSRPSPVYIPIIEEFLSKWKQSARDYYSKDIEEYYKRQNSEIELNKKLYDYKIPYEDRLKLQNDARELWKINFDWLQKQGGLIFKVCYHNRKETAYEKLDKALSKEVENRREDLIKRVEKKAGTIRDASGLYFSGVDINGYIIGEKAKVEVRTITAGGYNIQRLHYRVLVL